MYQRFLNHMRKSGMASLLQKKGAVLAAYSGGADSTLLLHWLYRWCREQKISLYAAHVHHGIRGEEADKDAEHCRKTAESMGIPLFIAHVDVPALAKERSMGIEECARAERYAYFDTVCAELHMHDMPVATAHNADDQLETVLFHMMRGSGLAGMTGIAPIREEKYIRPLLFMSGETIRKVCLEENYPFVEDSTNADTAYTRNYIRHDILPKLRRLHPQPEEAVNRMTELLARDREYLETEAASHLENARIHDREDCIARESLRYVHPAIGTRMLRMAYENCVPGCTMSREQTEELLRYAVSEENTVLRFSLPGGAFAEQRPDAVYFLRQADLEKRRSTAETTKPQETVVPVIARGETVITDWGRDKIVLSRESLPTQPENLENIYNLSIQQPINFATIKGVLCLRTRKPGDTILYKGIRRKIRKLQNEFHIPPESRETMVHLTDEEEILWVHGLEACDKVRTDGNATDILWIRYYSAEDSELCRRQHENDNTTEITEADYGTEN